MVKNMENVIEAGLRGLHWVLPPLSNSWIIDIFWLYIALNRNPNVDCYWVGAVPKAYSPLSLGSPGRHLLA